MILALEDNFLSSKATRQARKQAHEARKTARIQGRTARIEQRKTAKLTRQATRQEKRGERQAVGLEKQKKRMIRVKGKEEVIQARNKSKLAKFFNPTPSDSTAPSNGGGSPAPSGGGGGGGGPVSPGQDQYDDSQLTPSTGYDTSYDDSEDNNGYDDLPTYEESQDENDMQDNLSAGVIDTALKGLVGAGKGILQAYTGGQGIAGLLPQNMSAQQVIQLQQQNQYLQQQINSANNQKIIFGIGGLAVGGAIGFFIAKK